MNNEKISASDFDAEFDALPSASVESGLSPLPVTQRLGVVISGSLSRGLEVRLDRRVTTEELAVGSYVVIRGQQKRFFSMITDVTLGAASDDLLLNPPDLSDPFLRDVHVGVSTFGVVHLTPMLALEDGQPKPVKTVPAHFSEVRQASQEEVSEVFGEEGYDKARDTTFFHVGNPLDMEDVKITLDLKRFVERSSGVFGKSGTGKTFLSRLLLAGVIRERVAVNLIFDMHNEYGWEGSSEGATKHVKGLKQIFPDGRVRSSPWTTSPAGGAAPTPTTQSPSATTRWSRTTWRCCKASSTSASRKSARSMPCAGGWGRKWLVNFLDDDWIDGQGDFDPDSGKSENGLKALADEHGPDLPDAGRAASSLRGLSPVRFPSGQSARRLGRPHPASPRCRHQRRAGVRPLRQHAGRLHLRGQLPDPPAAPEICGEERARLRPDRPPSRRRW